MTVFPEKKVERKLLDQKSDYTPKSSIEEFIVPLLQENIKKEISAINDNLQKKTKSCLDVGCGNQPFKGFIENLGFKYTSVDVVQNKFNNVDFIAQIDNELPEALILTSPYDFIICTEVLEHVADWNKAFKNLSILLAPQGRLLITCPHYYVLHEQPYDFWRPTLHAIRYFAQTYAFEVVSSYPIGNAWDIIGTVLGSTEVIMKDYTTRSKILYRIILLSKKMLFALLKSRTIQKSIALENDKYPTYLSNVAVLTR